MNHLSIPADLLYQDENYGSGSNGEREQQGYGMGISFVPIVSPPNDDNDGALLGSFVPLDDWDGTIRVSATMIAVAQASSTAAEFYIQARVCNVGEKIEAPKANDVRHTVLLLIPDDSNSVTEPVLTWGPINPFTPDGSAFIAGALVTFRIAYNAGSENTTNPTGIVVRAVNFDL